MYRLDRRLGVLLVALSLTVFAVLTILAVRRPAPPKSPPGNGAGQAAAETEKSAAEDSAGLSDDTAHLETRRPVPVGLPKPTIPGSLAEAFDESRGLIDRMKAVDILRGNRTPGEFAAIRWLLRKSDEDEALRNSAARKLLEWGDERLAADLTDMTWDERETPKWRNYWGVPGPLTDYALDVCLRGGSLPPSGDPRQPACRPRRSQRRNR